MNVAAHASNHYSDSMWESIYSYWLIAAAILILAEFVLPGLVSVFVGLGAATVAALLYYQQIESIPAQFICFFASSMVYIFSLRLAVMKFYPSDTDRENIDEDVDVFGEIAKVVEDFDGDGNGRIFHSGSTWQARITSGAQLQAGDKVMIVDRSNITWIVKEI